MLFNFLGKINYILDVIQNYKDWYSIFYNRLFRIHTYKVHLRNGLILVGGPKSLILDLIDEIFVKKVYNPEFMEINVGDIVMDIGANIGVFSLYAAKQKAKKIYSIEPLPQNIPFIKKNIKVNKFNGPNIINVAVSNRNGVGKLYLGDLDSHGLFFSHNYKDGFVKFIEVPTLTLEKIINDNKIIKIDFLKIDCEGSEGEIIRSTNKDIWKKINKIAIEYHDKVSSLSHQEIVEKLKKNNYKIKVKVTGKLIGYIYAWKCGTN